MSELQPTAASAWRAPREQGFVVKLPSGNVARLRPVALDVMIASGQLPDILTPIAAKALWTETETDKIANEIELAKGFADLVNVVLPAAMMEPRVVDNPQADGEISADDVEFQDKLAVFQLATQPVEVLRRFCAGQAADVAVVPDSEGDRQPA